MPQEITIVSGIYPPDVGGPATFSEAFAGYLSDKRIRVNVVSTHESQKLHFQSSEFVVVKLFSRNSNIFFRTFRIAYEIGKKFRSSQLLIANGAFLETFFGSFLALRKARYVTKIPGDIVWERARNNNVTNLDIAEFQLEKLNFKYRVFRKLYSNSLKKARIVIVPSRGLYNLCIQWGVPREKLRLIYNSVELSDSSGLLTGENEYDLVTVCRLAPWKGVDELIQYSAKRNLKLVVAKVLEKPGLGACDELCERALR